jgi:hypothetical protein
MVKLYEFHDTSWLMASWWRECKNFTSQRNGWYGTINLRDPYIYFMDIIFHLYGENDYSKFSEAWMPLAYIVAITGSNFNWVAIISKKLSTCVQ